MSREHGKKSYSSNHVTLRGSWFATLCCCPDYIDTRALFSYELWTVFGESGLYVVQSCPLKLVAHLFVILCLVSVRGGAWVECAEGGGFICYNDCFCFDINTTGIWMYQQRQE